MTTIEKIEEILLKVSESRQEAEKERQRSEKDRQRSDKELKALQKKTEKAQLRGNEELKALQKKTEEAQQKTELARQKTEKAQQKTEEGLNRLEKSIEQSRKEWGGFIRNSAEATEEYFYRSLDKDKRLIALNIIGNSIDSGEVTTNPLNNVPSGFPAHLSFFSVICRTCTTSLPTRNFREGPLLQNITFIGA